ncbi:hypothetical protein PO909_021787, partial [Leuciscus waleckii]
MSSAEICRSVNTISSESADDYSMEGYSTHQGFRHVNINQPHGLLVSPHDQHEMGEKPPVQTSNICQILRPMQFVCDGGQVVMLNHCSPDQIPHSMMTDLNTEFSLSKLSVQSCSTEDQLPHGQGELQTSMIITHVDILIDLKRSYHAFFFYH